MSSAQKIGCHACGGEGEVLYLNEPDRVFGAPGAWTVVRCRNAECGLLWLTPSPTPDELRLAYAEYYTHGEQRRSRAYRVAAAAYSVVNDGLLAILGIPQERSRLRRMYLGAGRGQKLLDVGCGDGKFVAKMAKMGWLSFGIDPDPKAVDAARKYLGVNVTCVDLPELVDRHEKFDVITASHVIEHVSDAVEFLKMCKKLLSQNGRIILLTPNASSFGHNLCGRYWRGLEVPRHLFVFTQNALNACASRAGLAVASMSTTSANAGGMIGVSRVIGKFGKLDMKRMSLVDRLNEWAIRPIIAVRAHIQRIVDPGSGEEIYAVFTAAKESVNGNSRN